MNSKSIQHIGIDVSKASLDIYMNGNKIKIKNQSSDIDEWLNQYKDIPVQLNCESTGSYSRLLIQKCLCHNASIALINPRRIHNYAKVVNRHAKTDALDARLIHDFATNQSPTPLTDEWTKQDELKQYHTYAEQLKKLKTTLLNCLEHTDIKEIQADIHKQILTLDKRLKKIHDRIDAKLHEQDNNSAKIQAMENIAGVGSITSRTLLIWMPELGTLNRQTAAALAGLAPYNQDSGSKSKKATIRGGRPLPRKILYMAALSAARHNPTLRSYYQRLTARGKTPKIALIAVARKLLIHINSELKKLLPPAEQLQHTWTAISPLKNVRKT